MRAPALAAAAAVALVPAVVVTSAVLGEADAISWQDQCRDWSTTRFVLTATCRNGDDTLRISRLNLLSCREPRVISVEDGGLSCLPPEGPVAGDWTDRCVGGRIVDDGGAPRLVAFCVAEDGSYLMPESLRLADCAEPGRVLFEDGDLWCADASRITASGEGLGFIFGVQP